MELPLIKLDWAAGEPHNIIVLSDLHLESSSARLDRFRKFMRKTKQLENVSYVCLGDLADAIPPGDKRWVADRRRGEIEHWADELVDFLEAELGGYRWLWIAKGNHDIKHDSATSPIDRLCRRIGALPGGYSGLARLVYDLGGRHLQTLTWLYHHGRWGGALAKGYNGAMRWALSFSDWQLCTIGHNHQARIDPLPLYQIKHGGDKLLEKQRFFCSVPSWLRTFEIGGRPTYSEIGGYCAGQPWPAYIVRVVPTMRELKIAVLSGNAIL